MDLLYQYHYLAKLATEYRMLAMNQALVNVVNNPPATWNDIAHHAGHDATVSTGLYMSDMKRAGKYIK